MTAHHEIEPFRFVRAARRLLKPSIARAHEILDADFSDEVKFETLQTLGRIGDPSSLGTLMQAIDSFPERPEVISALGYMRSGSSVPALLKLLENQDYHYKEEVVRVLGDIGDPMAGKALTELLHDEDRMVRYYAARALYRIGGRDVAQSLCRLLSDPDEWIVINVLDILSRLKELEAIPALVGQFGIIRDPRLKAIIISSLATFAEPQLLKVFEDGLTSFDPRIQANSVEAISMLKIPALEMKRKLKKFYSHPNNRVRANVAIALHKCDSAKVLDEIHSMMESPDIPTRRSAAFVLSKIQLEGRDRLIDKLLADTAYGVRKMAMKAALALETEVSISRILPLIADENEWVRREAVDCARKIQGFPGEGILDAFTKESSPAVVESMLDFFAETGMNEAVEKILEKICQEPDEGLPRMLSTLGKLQAKDALVKAKKFLGPANREVLREFYCALLQHGELTVFEELAAHLKDKTREEELLTFLDVAGEIGLFIQNTSDYSDHLVQAMIPEIEKDLDGVISFDSVEEKPSVEDISQGIDLFNSGELIQALEFFRKYLRHYPGNNEALFHLATILVKQGNMNEALPALLELMERSPGHLAGGILLGQIHYRKKSWESLMELYEKLLDKISPDDSRNLGTVQGALGLAYFHLKRYTKAIEVLNKAMQTNSRDLSSCYHLALCYYAVKEHSRALSLLRSLRQNLPSDSRVFRNVEELLQKLEDEED